MSKEVTAEQGLSNGSHVLETEQLWEMVKQCWGEFPVETIARALSGHHQIANAIAACNGGDEFAKENNGLHCGVRKHYVPCFDGAEASTPTGVEVVTTFDGEDHEMTQLKYSKPDLSEATMTGLNEQELQCMLDNLPGTSHAWMEAATALANLQLGTGTGADDEDEE